MCYKRYCNNDVHSFPFLYSPCWKSAYDADDGLGIVTSRVSFDRENQKEYYMPIVMKDNGNPAMSGTSTLTIIIGDRNDNKHNPGHKEIYMYNYKGRMYF